MTWLKENWFRILVLILLFWIAVSFSRIAEEVKRLEIRGRIDVHENPPLEP